MSTDEYVPSEDDVRIEYVLAHQGLEAQLDAGEAYDRWLAAHDARVRRDAAREALDGFKAWRGTRQCPAISPPDPCNRPEGHSEPHAYTIPEGECDWREVDWSDTDIYRDQYYPEEPHE